LPSSLTQLRVLRLYGNRIAELPDTLGEMTQLETLQLGSIFGGNLLETFPERCLSKLINLRDLDLTQNRLVSLPLDIGHSQSKLVRLAVSENRLLTLPRSIGRCRFLRSFDLSRNSLLDLPIEITDLGSLETLDLTDNSLCVIPGDIALFMRKTTVLLTGNPFTSGSRRPDPPIRDDNTLTSRLESHQFAKKDCTSSNTATTNGPSQFLGTSSGPSFLLPSLRELAARQVLKNAVPIPRQHLPATLLHYLEGGSRPCHHCLNPYVREWVGCVEIKNYLGHPRVPRSVRFCSSTC
ncbi:L domain-like protein, partial [Basidiobolus meristosporus CBS 931.73]